MRVLHYFFLIIIVISLNSCSLYFWAYLRNLSKDYVTVDAHLKKSIAKTNTVTSIKTANKIVEFKKSYRRFFKDTTNILWVDSSHFRIIIKPNTTIDLEDIAGKFLNSHQHIDIAIFVTTKNSIDTLMTSRSDFRRQKFSYKSNGFMGLRPLLYYDIKD